MKSTRTQGWWLTRFELAVGVLLVVALVLAVWLRDGPMHEDSLEIGPSS